MVSEMGFECRNETDAVIKGESLEAWQRIKQLSPGLKYYAEVLEVTPATPDLPFGQVVLRVIEIDSTPMYADKPDYPDKIEIDLSGPNGNAYYLIGEAKRLAGQLGLDNEDIQARMQAGDYDHLVKVFEEEFGDYVKLTGGPNV